MAKAKKFKLVFPLRAKPKPRDGHRQPWHPRHLDWVGFKDKMATMARSIWPYPPITSRVQVDVHAYFDSDRWPDIDNAIGGVFDALSKVVFKSDRQILRTESELHAGETPERIEVTVSEYRNGR